ncbi:MAG: hypothetical protein AB1402_00310 [Bacillota bacterium]|jgi:hypothetical protein
MWRALFGLLGDERGQVIEYGLLIVLFVFIGAQFILAYFVTQTGVMGEVPGYFYQLYEKAGK